MTEKLCRTAMLSDLLDEDKRALGPGFLVENNLSHKLNLIFDVDHTLIFAFQVGENRTIQPGGAKDTHLLKLPSGMEMTLVVRQGLDQMLRYLSSFCTFYVYSHGLREYILKILEIIDPKEEYFFKRATRVLAPKDESEQKRMRATHKSLTDFKDPRDYS
jgi:hypothetical protein